MKILRYDSTLHNFSATKQWDKDKMHCRPLVATPALNTRATPSLLPQQPSRWHPPRRARRSQGSCSCAARTPPSPRRCGRASASTTSTPRARRSRPSSRPPRRRRTPRAPRSCWPAAPSRSTPRSWTPSPPSAASSPRAPEWTTSTSPSARAAASSSPARARSSPSTSLTTPSVSSSACSAASRPPTATSALGSGRRKGTTRLPPRFDFFLYLFYGSWFLFFPSSSFS